MKYRELERVNKETGVVEKDIIINGTTTIVQGRAYADKHLTNTVANKLTQAVAIMGALVFHGPITKGVAKLHPDDTYDEKTGIKIASRKAELKAAIKMHNAYADVIKLLSDCIEALDNEETKINERLEKVCNELNINIEGVDEEVANA